MTLSKRYNSTLSDSLETAKKYIAENLTEDEIIDLLPSLKQMTLHIAKSNEIKEFEKAYQAIEILINNLNRNKYLFSILVTALATKIVSPGIDIRNHQSEMLNSYSNRSTDARYITPFLKSNGLTHCAASGMESGRNFERPLPLDLNFPAKPQGKGNREAFLGIIDIVQNNKADPKELLTYILYKT